LYSVVGRVMKDDILWLTSEANSLDSITYGRQGSVLHYFKLSPYLLGVPLVLLVLAGLGWLLLRLRGKTAGAGADGELRVTALLMTGSFCALFVTYVAIWSLGIFDVIGDARHIARTGAGAVVTGMLGVRWALDFLGQRRALKVGFVGVLSLLGRCTRSIAWMDPDRPGRGERRDAARRAGSRTRGDAHYGRTRHDCPWRISGRVRTSCCLSRSDPIPR
jgi:hypothetical protein